MGEHTPDDTPDVDQPEEAIAESEEAAVRPELPEFSPRPRSVGEMLAAERRRQGKSVGDIANATRIRARLVEALEAGEWDHLPSPAYVRGYIQNYVSVLGLSAEPFLEAYRGDVVDGPRVPEESAALRDPILPKRDQAHAIPTRLLLGVVAFVAVVAVVWITLGLVGGDDTEPAPLPPVEEEAAPSEAVTEPVPGVTQDEPSPETDSGDIAVEPFELVVTVDDTDASWLRITVDGEKVYEGTLPGGDSRTYQVTDLATVRIGRPSVVTITRDGQPVEIPNTGELPTVELVADE